MTAAFTVRVQDEIAEKLDRIAVLSDRSRAYLAAQAIEDYVAREEWQLAEIQAGIDEADRGEFASANELASVVAKYVKAARQA
ncbi:CopG family ribbon-helix-helix protein [Sinorhizobium alkalisoli]|uniref:CopG family ribbon-helix-helix protein n=1 Tax=Sinorhizobium alkalisoli TaxID=1752398 RepID=UPI00124DCA7D|nr:CopG family ribbon-helix-helix protein [Sinorhizobium alkalisoli]QFI70024.1 Prevent host death protein, Phd antitoxin [Sinorhizobium alkalisoli]